MPRAESDAPLGADWDETNAGLCRWIGVDLAAPEHDRIVLVTVEIRRGQAPRVLVQREVVMSEVDVLVHVQQLPALQQPASEPQK